MRLAVIDCGTNTFHLLVIDARDPHHRKIIFKKTLPVKLGEGGYAEKIIAPPAFQRGIDALAAFRKYLDIYRPEKLAAFGTAALRNARNSRKFITTAKKQAGIEIEIIDGDREAAMIYYGVRLATALSAAPVLIMDIGGGSTEFIICNNKKILWKKSFHIGASQLMQQFMPSDPIMPSEIKALNNFFLKKLSPLLKQPELLNLHIETLIGSSGSFDTFAELAGWHFHNTDVLKGKKESEINPEQNRFIHRALMQSTSAQRKKMKGMELLRVDLIVVASVLLTFVLRKLKIKKITWSGYALKEGMIYSLLKSG